MKKRICVECVKDVEICDDRFDMIDADTGKIFAKNQKMVWANAWKLSKEVVKGYEKT